MYSHADRRDRDARNYERYKERFAGYSNEDLKTAKRNSRSNRGWVASRAAYELALNFELERRHIKV